MGVMMRLKNLFDAKIERSLEVWKTLMRCWITASSKWRTGT